MADRYQDIPLPEDMEDEMLEVDEDELEMEEEIESPLAGFETEELLEELRARGELPEAPVEDVDMEDELPM